jgi:transposase InsO family protein
MRHAACVRRCRRFKQRIRKGDCWDNAVAESFFSTLKTEALGDLMPVDHAAAGHIIREYIDGYYNVTRRHSFIDYETPIGFELKKAIAAKAAA